MLKRLRRLFDRDHVGSVVARARERHEAGDHEGAWKAARPLLRAAEEREAALALIGLLEDRVLGGPEGLEAAAVLLAARPDDPQVLGNLGSALESVTDRSQLNAAPPTAPVYASVAERLRELAGTRLDRDDELAVCAGLGTVARLLGRSWDAVAEQALRRRVELLPDRWQDQYDLGLFFKTRGRFEEGLAANRRAAELGGADDESVRWNAGICATGAGAGEEALAVWRELGQKLELGRFGLPEGSYQAVKVRLAERPLAERSADDDDPGVEETVWIVRLSPCHGVVQSALYGDLGVDYGDAVLFDGAPILHQKYGERSVPVFPHLVTLARPGYSVFPFGGTQQAEGQLSSLSDRLPDDAVVYVHSEQVVMTCLHCANDPGADHAEHNLGSHRVVTGKVCAPPSLSPEALLRALDEAVAAEPGVTLLVPDLARAAGDEARAEIEERRLAMLSGT